MPSVAFLHAHVLAVVLFLFLFAAKAALLLLNKRAALHKVRSKTKALDMLFGTLILLTGGYLLFLYNGGIPTWLILKIVLVLVAIPLGMVGIRRENKMLATLTLLLFLYVYGVAETKSLVMGKDSGLAQNTAPATPEADAAETGDAGLSQSASTQAAIVAAMGEAQLANAKAIYDQLCANCHGADGTKGMGGAAILTACNLSLNDRIRVIEEGRGLMPGFGDQLTEQEQEALAAYTITLKKE